MSWRCSECGALEGEEKIDMGIKEKNVLVHAVCHHCGKPLCQKDRILIKDNAFEHQPDTVVAYHCQTCKKAFHANDNAIEE